MTGARSICLDAYGVDESGRKYDLEIQRADHGAYIIYVNGEYRGNDELGMLMHDFNCTEADDMHYDLMAERTKYLKENPEGVSIMCKAMEEMRNHASEEKAIAIAKNLLQIGSLSYEEIAKATELTLAKVQELAGQLAG